MTDTIFFDVGNTLRIVIPDKEFSDAAERELNEAMEDQLEKYRAEEENGGQQ